MAGPPLTMEHAQWGKNRIQVEGEAGPTHNRHRHQSPVVRRALRHSSSKEGGTRMLLNSGWPTFPRAPTYRPALRKAPERGQRCRRTVHHFMIGSDQ